MMRPHFRIGYIYIIWPWLFADSAYKQCCNAYSQSALHISSVAMLIRRAALHISSVAMLIRRAALHTSSVKMAYLQSIRRTSTCSKSNIYLRGGGTDNILGGGHFA